MNLFTSESVTEGHPDKICDQISDAILDAILEQDPNGHVAVEAIVTTGLVHVIGEISTFGYVDIPQLVREVINDIGYTSSCLGFDGSSCGILTSIDNQSSAINKSVSNSIEKRRGIDKDIYDLQGAGDQGIIFGYACNDTPSLMPFPIWAAHRLSEALSNVRKKGIIKFLRPDGKTQITFQYKDGKPIAIKTILVSAQHDPNISHSQITEFLLKEVVKPILSMKEFNNIDKNKIEYILNPSGDFIVGGPKGDSGLTGRKIIVDTYGGMARHGGGSFSGKDPTKVDRSAAYALRWIAKNIVAANLADKIEIQAAYAISQAHPVGIYIDTFGTEKCSIKSIKHAIDGIFDLRPKAIIDTLNLKKPQYRKTATYGHFGRENLGFSWEKTDKVEELKNFCL